MADEPLDPPANTDAEVELDVRAFLPEGTDIDGDWGDDAPEPEVPAWARDDVEIDVARQPDTYREPIAPSVPGADDLVVVTDPDPSPAPEPDEQIDLAVLEGIEADLIEVDEAIAALDAGDVARSPLLQRLTVQP